MLKPCQHCHATFAIRPRQLCYRGYENKEIRALYQPKTTNFPKRSRRERRLAKRPTRALPGSEAKLRCGKSRTAGDVMGHSRDFATLCGCRKFH